MGLDANEEAVFGLDWGRVTPSAFSAPKNQAILVHNQEVMTEKGKSDFVAYMAGIAAHYQRHLPAGATQIHHLDIRGQAIDASAQASLRNRIHEALDAAQVTAEISIHFVER
jgi:hypothetical protein